MFSWKGAEGALTKELSCLWQVGAEPIQPPRVEMESVQPNEEQTEQLGALWNMVCTGASTLSRFVAIRIILRSPSVCIGSSPKFTRLWRVDNETTTNESPFEMM